MLILLLLTGLALSFYTTSRQEFRSASAAQNALRADLLSDSAFAIAQSFLKHDRAVHPTLTSLDHAWSTYFNGSWYVGKQWMWKDGASPLNRPGDRGVPEVDFALVQNLYLDGVDDDGKVHVKDNRELIYVPRVQVGTPGVADFYTTPLPDEFVTTAVTGESAFLAAAGLTGDSTPAEQIDKWADIDLDGDGLRDAMYLPIPIDTLADDDGIDNDLDGVVDELGELALFVYNGEFDALDNDGDGAIDEADEDRLFLTAPFYDQEGKDVTSQFTYNGATPAVDVLDNDYSLIKNDSFGYIYREVDATPEDLSREFHEIAKAYFGGSFTIDGESISVSDAVITFSGEPVCEVAGRVAILIKDEASKINVNAAGAVSLRDDAPGTNEGLTTRSMAGGLSPAEYEMRVMPQIDLALSSRIANLRSGAPEFEAPDNLWGFAYASSVFQQSTPDGPFAYDISLPGYGRTDDNGNAFWAAMNGLDDDGDGVIDEGINPFYPELFLKFEGIDEPEEFRLFRPLRNLLAESDGIDNDGDEFPDEIGEFGDRLYRTREQLKLVDGIAGGRFTDNLRDIATVYSFDENVRYKYYDQSGNALQPQQTFEEAVNNGPPLTSGLKLDYNIALADHIAEALRTDWGYPKLDASMFRYEVDEKRRGIHYFTLGLRMNAVTAKAQDGLLEIPTTSAKLYYTFGYDGPGTGTDMFLDELRALQLATNIQDARDPDHARTTARTFVNDYWWNGDPFVAGPTGINDGDSRVISYTASGRESIIINEIMARPVRRVEAEMLMSNATPQYGRTGDYVQLNGNAFTSDYWPSGIVDFNMRTSILPHELILVEEPLSLDILEDLVDNVTGAATPDGIWDEGWGYEPRRVPGGDEDDYSGVPAPPIGDLNNMGLDFDIGSVIISESGIGVGDDHEVPYLVEFRFRPSPKLPPGRYYLLANMTAPDGTPTVTDPGQIHYAVKYGDTNESIVNDVVETGGIPSNFVHLINNDSAAVTNPDSYQGFAEAPLYHQVILGYERNDPAAPQTGWMWFPVLKQPDSENATPEYFEAGGAPYPNIPPGLESTYGQYMEGDEFRGWTVVIPEYSANQEFLYLAVWKDPANPDPLNINFFEFSQEPDHEWVEVLNTAESGDPVDMSGWQLVVEGEQRTIMRVPDDTFIAPGGSLLLAVNKYDYGLYDAGVGINLYENPILEAAQVSKFFRNGIALAATSDNGPFPAFPGTGAGVLGISYPAIPTIDPAIDISTGLPRNLPINESVFYRPEDLDFVDQNGNGIFDGDEPDVVLDNLVESTNDTYPFHPDVTYAWSTPNTDRRQSAWDRIVQLDILGIQSVGAGVSNSEELAALARFILGGGILPNYPEHDGWDNDDDALFWLQDGFDNDLDGFIDADDNITDPGDPDYAAAYPPEAIDENRLYYDFRRRDLALGEPDDSTEVVPGGYDDDLVDFSIAMDAPGLSFPAYARGVSDPPEWKSFVERRMLPGDNVILTLYEGAAFRGRIADRVTYTEQDVINRAIDDVKTCPLRYATAGGGTYPATLHASYPSLWPDNTMGVDFYRALERKHFLWPGDRFGTQSRWEATDGNYDDWDEGTSDWTYDPNLSTAVSRLDEGDILFGHGLSGSPLRANFFARGLENPGNQFTGAAGDPYLAAGAVDRRWKLERALNRNQTYSSPGDLMRLPMMTVVKNLYNDLGGDLSLIETDAVLVGEDATRDLAALLVTGSQSGMTLTVGQAAVYPVTPKPAAVDPNVPGSDPTLIQWNAAADLLPRAWAPLYLFALPGETPGDVVTRTQDDLPYLRSSGQSLTSELNYLFNTPAAATGFPNADLAERWPLELRTVMYVSANPNSFDPDAYPDHEGVYKPIVEGGLDPEYWPAEALFVWDGDDGLENGEYDIYVATADVLDTLYSLPVAADDAGVDNPLTNIAGELTLAADASEPRDIAVDLEFFTDRNADRRCWTDINETGHIALYPDRDANPVFDEFNRNEINGPSESFGKVNSAVPSTDGYIHYGTVRVENNYLALLLRNWGRSDYLNRFSRIILLGRTTPGRLNINTVEARLAPTGVDGQFNALMGIPGVLARDFNNDPVPSASLPGDATPVPPNASRIATQPQWQPDAFDLSQDITGRKPIWVDGRYYRFPADMLILDDATAVEQVYRETLVNEDFPGAPNTPEEDAWAFDQAAYRYSRLANLVTTRSDVFEIYVHAETGYLATEDLNGDGRIDFRNDFVTLAEKRMRGVYER